MSDYYGPPRGASDNGGGGRGGARGGRGGGSNIPFPHQQSHHFPPPPPRGRGGGGHTHHTNRSGGGPPLPPPPQPPGAAGTNAAAPGGGGGGLDQGKIFVGGLSWQTTEESLRFHFEQYGPVASVEVMRDRNTGDPRGFAFVVFHDGATVDLVMEEEKHEINHKVVDVKRAQARGIAPPSIHGAEDRPPPAAGVGGSVGGGGGGPGGGASAGGAGPHRGSHFTNKSHGGPIRGGGDHGGDDDEYGGDGLSPEQLHNKVFVGGIPPHVDRDGLKDLFSEFGTVVDAIVMIDQVTNRSRGFGFVTFENGSNGAQKAIAQQPLDYQGRKIEVKLATPKAEQRRAPPAAGPKHVGLRAGMSSGSSSGEYAGFAVVRVSMTIP
jgi:RNA-binding protein Musashi